jgi:hypothetical protein
VESSLAVLSSEILNKELEVIPPQEPVDLLVDI